MKTLDKPDSGRVAPASSAGTERTPTLYTRFVPCASVPGEPWYCWHTLPGKENRTEHQMRQYGAAGWLPLFAAPRSDGQMNIRPLFPRYVFGQMTGERLRWGWTVRTRGGEELAQVLRSPAGKPLPIPAAELERLFKQCAPNGVIYPPEARELEPEDTGRVVSGPLSGFQGVCARATRDRVWLLLSILGRSVETPFKRAQVELVG